MGADVPPASHVPLRHAPPTDSTVKELYATALTCGIPDCGEPLYRENPVTGQRLLNSRIAHIHARSEGGPRWDPGMSKEDNRSFGNLILLCERHASEIDATPDDYPADLLRAWKERQIETRSRAVGLALSDAEVAQVAAVSFNMDDLVERMSAVVPFTPRLRSRQDGLDLASRRCRARSVVRLRSTPADRVRAVLAWKAEHAGPVVAVPEGALRVLVAPMGAGKSEEAERWWSQGLTQAWADSEIDIPLWLEAREITSTLAQAVQDALGNDPVRTCRVVIDNLDAVSPRQADQLLCDARQLVQVWPRVSVLATTRPGAGSVEDDERLPVPPWPPRRGLQLLRTVLGEEYLRVPDRHETRHLLTSPLQVHALASRLRAGGDTHVSARELLSQLATRILQREHPQASRDVWEALPRLAARILDQQGPVQASSFAPQHLIWELEETGLIVHDGGLLRFALPLFEQHFAAQALQEGHTPLASAAAPQSFPHWRYAIAFVVAAAPDEDAEALVRTLTRTNPAAASWVLDETATAPGDRSLSPAAPAREATVGSDGREQVPAVARQLREATLCWLASLEPLGPLLVPHEQGQLIPWAVQLDHDWLTVAQARPGVLDEDLVAWADLASLPNPLTRFHDRTSFPAPHGRLACWERARSLLRPALANRIQQRTLPVAPTSPLAAERAWFLARQIMAKGHYSRVGQHIRLSDLQTELDILKDQSATYVRASWQWGGGRKIDSDDVRWLSTHLHHIQGDTLANPRPPADRMSPSPRFLWQAYSPALTRSITADVLRDALIGYRDLVELNFPRFGAALGLYSIFPVRAEGMVAMPTDESQPQPATVMYALRPDATSAPQDQPTVDLRLSDEPHLPASSLWESLREDSFSAFRSPGVVHQEALLPYHDRQATNLAYHWLAKDLQAVGWLERAVTFPE
ncbi:hypothetical protein [Streptomyces lanatus]|uniref:HNH endonuclease n=1 Tax=Streptomyces lanatus TaxID=66900 RepID=A0ABV1Y3M3_9ACTN|nr:hypothetical protein [Streptomyces lanatus]